MTQFKRLLSVILSVIIAFTAVSSIINLKVNAAQLISETVPAAYKDYISVLKEKHPNWKFEFLYTGLDWDTVISNETADGRSLVSYISPKSYRSIVSSAYNSSTDTYIAKDSGSWYQANETTIKYYMDPRNFLNEENIFQFEKLTYDEATQNINGVKTMLAGSFMSSALISNGSKSISYAQAFMDAAKVSNINPYHLTSKVLQEVGKNGSGSTSGKYPQYEGYYNFYNIGATASSNPIANGLDWASRNVANDIYLRPWNSQYKSIVGGAIYIGRNYINKGQNTIYLEKFDVDSSYNGLYWHQYMGNISGAVTEGKKVYDAYRNLNMLNDSYTFVIPVYSGLPAATCHLPINTGSPQCWLSKLLIDGTTVTPSNALQVETNVFSATVSSAVESVKVTASAYNSKSTITGLQKTSSSQLNTGRVYDVSTFLKVRYSAGVSSPDPNTNRLKYNGSYVNLLNDTPVSIIASTICSGTKWYEISFAYDGKTLTGWVSGDYIKVDDAVITNFDTLKLNYGLNVFTIKVTAVSGDSRIYTLNITRTPKQEDIPETNGQKGIKTSYGIDKTNKIIKGIPANTSVDTVLKELGIQKDTTVKFYKEDNSELKSGLVGTGTKITISYISDSTTYIAVILGDPNGDGETNIFDIIKTRNQILGSSTVSGVYKMAMDTDGNGEIDIFDLIKIRNMSLL